MSSLSENYHLRKCFLQREQVPTQRMMRNKMSPPLAAIYFDSMTPRLKKIAGLEPRLKGAGHDWYVPPEDLLEGRTVLKPAKKQVIDQLNHHGIETLGTTLFENHRKKMALQLKETLFQSDIQCKNNVTDTTHQLWNDLVAIASKKTSKQIMNDFNHFAYLYRQSIGKIEILFHESAIEEIKNTRERTLHAMKNKYETTLKYQATSLYDEYEKKLVEEKTRLKDEFIQNLEIHRTAMVDKIHDLNVDKHKAIDKMKRCLQRQNLACQIYVALKEREECFKENEELKHSHKKTMKVMTDTILTKDKEIHLQLKKKIKQKEFSNIWHKKACRVMKAFQMFVSYCLNMLPEHAEFFINMEKLMLLQLNETLDDPTDACVIKVEKDQFHSPVAPLRPFYLFCDKGYKAKIDLDLCSKRSYHSSDSDLPAVIINKRCLYAACDNFKQFTNKITEFIQGNRGDDADIKDDLVYEHFVPVKYESSQQLLERNLESSLLQVLQQEIAYVQTDNNTVPIECHSRYEDADQCSHCGLLWGLCPCLTQTGESKVIKASSSIHHLEASPSVSRFKMPPLGKHVQLDHERQPKWESFCRHVEPNKCSCAKTAKKNLAEHLPVYMRQMTYGPPETPGYKMCSMIELKALVKKSKIGSLPPITVAIPSKTEKDLTKKDMSTQYYDPVFEELCTCFSCCSEDFFY